MVKFTEQDIGKTVFIKHLNVYGRLVGARKRVSYTVEREDGNGHNGIWDPRMQDYIWGSPADNNSNWSVEEYNLELAELEVEVENYSIF